MTADIKVGFFYAYKREIIKDAECGLRKRPQGFAKWFLNNSQSVFFRVMFKNHLEMNTENNSSQPLQVLNKSELCGRQFTVYGTADQPLFLAKDVAEMIEHTNPRVMLDVVEEDEKVVNNVYTLGGNQQAWFLTEDGLYEVLMQSRKPIAKEFKHGVKQILKEIRKNGAYVAAQPDESPELLMARALKAADEAIQRQKQQLQEANQHIAIAEETIEQQARQIQMANGTIEEQTREIKALAPDAKYTRDVLQSDSTYAISDVAKELRMSGYKLYAKLKALGILFKRGDKWFPYEKYVPKGYFATRTVPFFHRDGTPGSSSYTVLTELGRQWLHSLKIA